VAPPWDLFIRMVADSRWGSPYWPPCGHACTHPVPERQRARCMERRLAGSVATRWAGDRRSPTADP